jgi:hypothetical protein
VCCQLTTGLAVPFVSTNDIISSAFMKGVGAPMGAMAANFRDRLDGLTKDHAGNYEALVFFLVRGRVVRARR